MPFIPYLMLYRKGSGVCSDVCLCVCRQAVNRKLGQGEREGGRGEGERERGREEGEREGGSEKG